MVEAVNNLLVGDVKVIRKFEKKEDCRRLQEVINKFYKWNKKWEIIFNVRKCKFMELSNGIQRGLARNIQWKVI